MPHSSLFAHRVHPSVRAAVALLQLIENRPSDIVHSDSSTSRAWIVWRWVPFGFLALGLVLLLMLRLRHSRCASSLIRGEDEEDERISQIPSSEPLRASLLAQSSLGSSMRRSSTLSDPLSPAALGLLTDSPESPYSPHHTHPYAFASYQHSVGLGVDDDGSGGPTLSLLHPPNDLVTPHQPHRSIIFPPPRENTPELHYQRVFTHV